MRVKRQYQKDSKSHKDRLLMRSARRSRREHIINDRIREIMNSDHTLKDAIILQNNNIVTKLDTTREKKKSTAEKELEKRKLTEKSEISKN